MINVFHANGSNGPGKVIKNLFLGFNKLGIQYRSNPNNTNLGEKSIILQNHKILNSSIIHNAIIGPNICVIPPDNNIVMGQQYKKMIVPSEWVKQKYMRWLSEDKLTVWPVGVDTDTFSDKSKQEKTNDCLIYFKRRSNQELETIKNFLSSVGQTFEVIKYDPYKQTYTEEHFLNVISRSRYGIVIDNCESQGLAIEEMLSCNLPLLVWDITHWNDRGEDFKVSGTSIPYWDDRCGFSFTNDNELIPSYEKFISNLNTYSPRDFIVEELNIEKQTNEIIKMLNG